MSLPVVLHYNQEIANFSRQKQYDQALQSFERMKQNRVRPDVVTYNTMINVFVKSQRLNDAFALFEQMKSEKIEPTIITYTSLIDGCGKCSNLRRAMQVYHQVKSIGIQLNMHLFNAILNATFLKGNLQSVDAILADIKESGLKPNTVTYNTLLAGYIRFDLLERMKPAIKEMIDSKVEFSSITQTTILQATQLVRDQQSLFQFIDLLQTASFVPTKTQATQIILDMVSTKKLNIAQQMFDFLIKIRCQFAEDAFTNFVELAGEFSNYSMIQWGQKAALSYGYDISFQAYLAQLYLLSKFNNYDMSVKAYEQIENNPSIMKMVPSKLKISLIQCFMNHNNIDGAYKVAQQLSGSSSFSDKDADNILSLFFDRELHDKVLELSLFIREHNITLGTKGSNYTLLSAIKSNNFSTLIPAITEFQPSPDVIAEVIESISDNDAQLVPWASIIDSFQKAPPPSILSSIMYSFTQKHLENFAWLSFRKFISLGTELTENVLAIASGIVTPTYEDDVLFLINTAKDSGIELSAIIYSMGVDSAIKNGDFATAVQLKNEMDSLNYILQGETKALYDQNFEYIKHALPPVPPPIVRKERTRSKTMPASSNFMKQNSLIGGMEEISKRSAMMVLDGF